MLSINLFSFLIMMFFCDFSKGLADDDNTLLLISDANNIIILDTSTLSEIIVAEGNAWVLYLDFHYRKRLIFWSDYSAGTISRILFPSDNSTSAEIIIHSQNPTGVAVDTDNDFLYWADLSLGKISRSNLDGSNTSLIISTNSPKDIELDISNGWIYFTFNGNDAIGKSRMDGSEKQTIIDNIGTTENLALDFHEDRIYWTENGNHKVRSAFFDGSEAKIIKDGISVGYPYGITTTHSNVYFSTWNTGHLFVLSKNNASASNHLIYTTGRNLMSIKVFRSTVSECFNYVEIQNEEKRSTGYHIDLEIDIPISDDEKDGGWYRIMSDNGDEIPTYPPGLSHCGTFYPIWLNGHLPASWKTNSIEACQQTATDICETSLNITISNCGSYYVYYLSTTPENSSYCFGDGPVTCPTNKSSESGYFPGCSSNFPKEFVPVMVKPELISGPSFQIPGYDITPSLLSVFRCFFEDISNGTYVYDVFWKINGNNVTSKLNVPFENIDSTFLRDTDWVGLYTMNMEVKCSIRMRYSANATPGKFIESQNFQAGLFPEKYDYTVIEGEKIKIHFTATVPVSCIASHEGIKVHCDQAFYIFQPEFDQQSLSCLNNIVNRDVVFQSQFCGIKIGTNDWQETKTLDVYGFSDGLYNFKDRSTNIRFSTGAISTFNEIWKNINIPDIKVTVLDKDTVLTNRLCQSVNDPHISSFDGRYYHFMDVGEFVMYRNDRGPYWVHALFTNCGFGWEGSSCHCGIAIRSRNSRFVIRTCKTISRTKKSLLDSPITQLDSCNDNDFLIEHTGNKYKVTIPSGTEITITISRWSRFIGSVTIKPSVYDIDRVKGLCGVPSITMDPSDDYTHRTKGPVNDDQDFAHSWRITTEMTDEQMFVETPTFVSDSYTIDTYSSEYINNAGSTYCACEQQAKSTDSLDKFYTVHCNLTESTEYCPSKSLDNTVNAYQTSCSGSRTMKRSIGSREIVRRSTNDNDDVVEFLSLTYDEDVNSTVTVVQQTFRNGWTEGNAYQECLAVINNTLPSDLYGDFADLQRVNYIIGCVKDIELTGNTVFLKDTIEAMVINIMTEIQKNESLYLFNSTEGNQTILEYISAKLCPSNCSGHGNCTIAVCICFDGFIGDDCSHSVASPPKNISLPSYGLCSTTTRSCQKTNVYVDILSETVWYRIRHFQILDDLIIITSEWEVDSAEYRNMFMVSVSLHKNRKRRSVSNGKTAEGYEISLSYNNQNYGDVVSIIIYDETCFSCNSTTRTCINLAGCESSILKSEIVKALGASIGVVFVFVCFVIGFICCKYGNKSQKLQSKVSIEDYSASSKDLDYQMTSSQTWKNKNNTVDDIDLHVDDVNNTLTKHQTHEDHQISNM